MSFIAVKKERIYQRASLVNTKDCQGGTMQLEKCHTPNLANNLPVGSGNTHLKTA